MNISGLRRTHAAFVEWLLSDHHMQDGMSFGAHGPVDQGAYNSYYQGRFAVRKYPLW